MSPAVQSGIMLAITIIGWVVMGCAFHMVRIVNEDGPCEGLAILATTIIHVLFAFTAGLRVYQLYILITIPNVNIPKL